MVYVGLLERLNTLLLRASTAYYLHATDPRVLGNEEEAFRQWCAAQEVRNALKEQNPGFAATLLPTAPSLAAVNGLPLLPAGIRYVVDDIQADTVALSAEVAGVTFTVHPPAGAAYEAKVVPGVGRTSTTLPARLDGLYEVAVEVGTTRVTTILVPVNRPLLRALRQNGRQAAYAFENHVSDPNPAYRSRLARWIGADAAAATGQRQLYFDLIASADKVARAPTPTALYPHPHG